MNITSGYTASMKEAGAKSLAADHATGLIELCRDAVLLCRQGLLAHVNRAALDLIGARDAADLRGLTMGDLFPSEAGTPQQQCLAPPDAQAGDPLSSRLLRRLDGTTMRVEVSSAPFVLDELADAALVIRPAPEAAGFGSSSLPAPQPEPKPNKGANKGPNKGPDEIREEASGSHAGRVATSIPALLAYIDADERLHYANPASLSWFGKPPEAITGRTAAELFDADYPVLQPYIGRALGGEQLRFECTLRGHHGGRHAVIALAPDMAAAGAPHGLSLIVMDITERRSPEKRPRERGAQLRQLQQLRTITDAVPVFIAQCDRDYRLRFINRMYSASLDASPREMIGKRIPELVGDEVFAQAKETIDAALAGNPQERELRIALPNGERFLHMMFVPEFDIQGKVHGIVAAVSDVTHLRHTEERLYRREQEFKTLVENSPDAISRIGRDMRHLYANPAIETVTGVAAERFLGRTNAELGLPEDMSRAWDDAVREAFATTREQRFDFTLTLTGQARHYAARAIPEMNRDGGVESVLGIMYDMTERSEMESENRHLLERERSARIQAETAARARDEFLAIVSHELRAPLNGIQSWAHILENYVKDVPISALTQRALTGIKTGVAQQVRLIEDLLDVTRMMSGKLRLVKQPFMLLPVIQAAVENVRGAVVAKNITLHCEYAIDGEEVNGDADRVQQVIWNLLSNAVKFTPDGGNIWISVLRIDDRLKVEVRDDGAGIKNEFIPFLFDRFSQEDTSSTRGHSGLGLGLFLVRHLVEMHGGKAGVESAGEGKGAAFWFMLPLRTVSNRYLHPPGSEIHAAGPLPSLGGLRILLVDDQEDVRESLAIVLSSAGASVHAAGSLPDILSWLSTLSATDLPHILVSDIAMPVDDGYAVLRSLRGWKQSSGDAPLQRMPALALTAFAQREDRIKALTAGFQMHMTKPVAPEELIVVIAMMAARG